MKSDPPDAVYEMTVRVVLAKRLPGYDSQALTRDILNELNLMSLDRESERFQYFVASALWAYACHKKLINERELSNGHLWFMRISKMIEETIPRDI